jgi:hypothetical protein
MVALSPAVRVTKDTTYVASFLSSDGTYYADPGFFNATFDAAPLHAPAGTNGVYKYGGGFPTDSFDATSYGADVLFTPTDQTPPQIAAVAPAGGATGVDPGAQVTVAFDEGVDPATVHSGSFFLRNEAGALVPADVSYDAATRTATLRPRSALAWATTYTATVDGGAGGLADLAGNPLAQDRTWSFTTAAPPPGFNGPGEVGTKGSPSGSNASPHGSTSSAAKRVTVSPRTVRASKNGTVRLRVTCPAGTRGCRVQLKLQVGKRTVATKTVTVAAGKTKTVTLVLSRAARSDLKRKRSLRATAIASANGASARAPTLLLSPRRH